MYSCHKRNNCPAKRSFDNSTLQDRCTSIFGRHSATRGMRPAELIVPVIRAWPQLTSLLVVGVFCLADENDAMAVCGKRRARLHRSNSPIKPACRGGRASFAILGNVPRLDVPNPAETSCGSPARLRWRIPTHHHFFEAATSNRRSRTSEPRH